MHEIRISVIGIRVICRKFPAMQNVHHCTETVAKFFSLHCFSFASGTKMLLRLRDEVSLDF